MSADSTTRTAGRHALVAALLIGAAGCHDLPTTPPGARPGAPAHRLGDAPVGTIPGPLDVTPQPPPPSFQ